MQPRISLDRPTLAANALAWRRFSGVPLYAVVKADGYGWGLDAVVPALEDACDCFCVADEDELRALRAYTNRRAIVLGTVPPEALGRVVSAGAMPTIETGQDAQIAIAAGAGAREFPLRVGLRQAAAWSGLDLAALRALAPYLASRGAFVQLWSHLTDEAAAPSQAALVEQGLEVLRTAGVNVAGSDIASTFPLARGLCTGSAVRIGAGLFGAGASRVPGVQCAIRVDARIVRMARVAAGTRTGYGSAVLDEDGELAIARCGYADGYPAGGLSDRILAVGMQYVTVRADNGMRVNTMLALVDAATDLDSLAARSGRLPHEIITALGNSARVKTGA